MKFSIFRATHQSSEVKTNLAIMISKPCKDPVNDYRVVANEITVVGLKANSDVQY